MCLLASCVAINADVCREDSDCEACSRCVNGACELAEERLNACGRCGPAASCDGGADHDTGHQDDAAVDSGMADRTGVDSSVTADALSAPVDGGETDLGNLQRDPNAVVSITSPEPGSVLLGLETVHFEVVLLNPIAAIKLSQRDTSNDEETLVNVSNGAARSLQWDTSDSHNGVVELWIEVEDLGGHRYESEPVTVVFANGGMLPMLIEGLSGRLSVPSDYDGSSVLHLKHHFEMPSGYYRVISLVTWNSTGTGNAWSLELVQGEGACPHSGQTRGQPGVSTESPVWTQYSPLFELNPVQWFVQVQPLNPNLHLGEDLDVTFTVVVLPTP